MSTQTLTYQRPSALTDPRRLVLETGGGRALLHPAAHPRFFDGWVTRPHLVAEALRQVASVAAAEYWRRERVPAGGGFDPVVTSDGRMLRFESFSLCGGVQARLDLEPEILDGDLLDRGTTNVDVNEPLRRMLTGVAADGMLHLSVGSDGLVATTGEGAVVERRVPLSTRWLRGFAEAQQLASTFELRTELDGRQAAAFLTGLARDTRGWVVPAGRGWRLSSRAAPGSVHLSGSARLASLLPLVRHATALRAYGPLASGSAPTASAWELRLPGLRYVLMLSPEPARGFSGEGAGLTVLAGRGALDDADEVGRLLDYQVRLEPDLLAEQTGLPAERVRAALACLAVAGRVGYDVTTAAYFQRDLPYDATSVGRLNPRLRQAEELVAAGAVTAVDASVAEVVSGERTYRVRTRDDGSTACTCTWWTTHRGARGPCKHVLAATLVTSRASAG